MIIDSFDNISEPIITPQSFFGEKKNICDIAIGTFSREIYPAVLAKYPHEEIGELRAANKIKKIHLLNVGGKKVVFYLSEIGATLAGTDIIELNWLSGADKFILFGSAGSLDKERTTGKYVIPTEAYRDEGMSYHYAEADDYITVKNADQLADVFTKHELPFVKGKVWTTDALYRETRDAVRQRKEEGCIAVEMELAGVQAVCDYHGFELYDFLVTGDVVDQPDYSPDGLTEANHSLDKFDVALAIARSIKTVPYVPANPGVRPHNTDVLKNFHRNRFIMHILLAISVVLSISGIAVMFKRPIILCTGLLVLLVSLFFGAFTGAMCCPYCGHPIGRNSFGPRCTNCGRRIL